MISQEIKTQIQYFFSPSLREGALAESFIFYKWHVGMGFFPWPQAPIGKIQI